MFSISAEIDAELAALDRLPALLDRQVPELLGEIGRGTVAHAHRDFVTKSRGGTGEDGVAWPPLRPATIRQKQRRGRPLAIGGSLDDLGHIRATVAGEAVAVEFVDQPKANYFDELRPLLPNRLPDKWYQDAETIAQRHVDAVALDLFTD